MSPALGLLSVGLASALANHVTRQLDHSLATGQGPLSLPLRARTVALDAVLGAAVYRSLGSRFASVLPSDVRFPGARVQGSLPAKGREYATPAERAQLQAMMRRDGCHHCGRRKGKVIGDHMPPNKSAHGGTTGAFGPTNWGNPEEVRAQALRTLKQLPLVGRVVLEYQPPPQRYYPQCEPCSLVQSNVMRTGKGKYVIRHTGRIRRSDLAGVAPAPLRYHLLGGSGPEGPWGYPELVQRATGARRQLARDLRAGCAGVKKATGVDLTPHLRPCVEWLEEGGGAGAVKGPGGAPAASVKQRVGRSPPGPRI